MEDGGLDCSCDGEMVKKVTDEIDGEMYGDV